MADITVSTQRVTKAFVEFSLPVHFTPHKHNQGMEGGYTHCVTDVELEYTANKHRTSLFIRAAALPLNDKGDGPDREEDPEWWDYGLHGRIDQAIFGILYEATFEMVRQGRMPPSLMLVQSMMDDPRALAAWAAACAGLDPAEATTVVAERAKQLREGIDYLTNLSAAWVAARDVWADRTMRAMGR